jgi:hypothetical protein
MSAHTPATRSYQTVRLGRGGHHEPGDEVCVMELASMLAGEPFTDHPRASCPVIGAFLRAYNDRVDDDRRQDLYAYAARVVGTRATAEVEAARAQRCRAWAQERAHERPRGLRWLTTPSRRLWRSSPEASGTQAARAVRINDETHRQVLALIDELVAIGGHDTAPMSSVAGPPAGLGSLRWAAERENHVSEEIPYV